MDWLQQEYGVEGAEKYLRQQIVDACAAFSTTAKSPLLIWRKDRPALYQQQLVNAAVLYVTPTRGNLFYRLHCNEKNWSAAIPGFIFAVNANPCNDSAVPILRYVEGVFEPVVVTDELETRLAKIRSKLVYR